MYSSLKDHVIDVENALSDVRSLLAQQAHEGWETEFADIVQDVLRQDSGWESVCFTMSLCSGCPLNL